MTRSWSLLAAWITLIVAVGVLAAEVQSNADHTRQVVCGTLVAQIDVTLLANKQIITPETGAALRDGLDDLWTRSGCVGEVPPEWSQPG